MRWAKEEEEDEDEEEDEEDMNSTCNVTMACEREDRALASVEEVALLALPARMHVNASSMEVTSVRNVSPPVRKMPRDFDSCSSMDVEDKPPPRPPPMLSRPMDILRPP